jgi:thymidine phosphorylase
VADRDGFVAAIDAEALGRAIAELGGSRTHIANRIDFSVGCEILVRVGDQVQHGQPLVRVFARPHLTEFVRPLIKSAVKIEEVKPSTFPLVVERIDRASL